MCNTLKSMRLFEVSWLVVLILMGCHHDKKPSASKEFFQPESETRDIHRYVAAQCAAGARTSATLLPQHFDGSNVNSLGRQMLSLIAYERPALSPVTIYVPIVKDDTLASARREQVKTFLRHSGLRENEIQLKEGTNPATATIAAPTLARLPKTESGTITSSPAAPQGK